MPRRGAAAARSAPGSSALHLAAAHGAAGPAAVILDFQGMAFGASAAAAARARRRARHDV